VNTNNIRIIGGATTRTMRVHWAAHELGLDYESQLIGSRTGATQTEEFLALNAKAKIPVLQHNSLILTESAAIIHYLDQAAAQNAATTLIPKEPDEQVRYQEWQSYILMELDAQTLYIMRKHRDLEHIYGAAPAAIETAESGFNFQVQVAARALESTPFLLGNAFTGVDILLTTCLDWALAYEFTLADPLLRYLERIHSRDAYINARAHNYSIAAGA